MRYHEHLKEAGWERKSLFHPGRLFKMAAVLTLPAPARQDAPLRRQGPASKEAHRTLCRTLSLGAK